MPGYWPSSFFTCTSVPFKRVRGTIVFKAGIFFFNKVVVKEQGGTNKIESWSLLSHIVVALKRAVFFFFTGPTQPTLPSALLGLLLGFFIPLSVE